MPASIRRLIGAGVVFTVVGLIGLALTVGRDTGGALRWISVACYALGAGFLVTGGIRWLLIWTRRRDG